MKTSKNNITYSKYIFKKIVLDLAPSVAFGISIGGFIFNNYIEPGLLKELIVPIISRFIFYYIIALPIFLLIPKSAWKGFRKKYDKLYKN